MKIDNTTGVGMLEQSSRQEPLEETRKDPVGESRPQGDSSNVSDLARQIAEARRVADEIPDVRADALERARTRLAQGFYESPEAREILVSKLAELIRGGGT